MCESGDGAESRCVFESAVTYLGYRPEKRASKRPAWGLYEKQILMLRGGRGVGRNDL